MLPHAPHCAGPVVLSSKPLLRRVSIIAHTVPLLTFTSSLYFQSPGLTRYPFVSGPIALVNVTSIRRMLSPTNVPVRGGTSKPPTSEPSTPNRRESSFVKSARGRPFSSCMPGRSAVAMMWTPFARTFSRRKRRTGLFVEFGTAVSTRMLRGRMITR